ncbi:MAG: hypothetical protein AABX39_05855, partial [Nanoarchaeota archaeon]
VKPKHLTPVASRKYRAIAERLVSAGCILLCIIGVFYYRSNFKKSVNTTNNLQLTLQEKEEDIKKLNNNLSNKDQEITKLSGNLDKKYSEIMSLENEKGSLQKGKKDLEKNIRELKKNQSKTIDTTDKWKDVVIANKQNGGDTIPRKESVAQVQSNSGSGTAGRTQIENNSDTRKEISKESIPGAKEKEENPATKNGEGVSKPESKDAYKSEPVTLKSQKNGGISEKNNEQTNKQNDNETMLTIVVKSSDNKSLKDAIVYIDDKQCENKTDNDGTLKIKASRNKHKLKVMKDGFETVEKLIKLSMYPEKCEIVLKNAR